MTDIKIIYLYAYSGDLVHCNQCEANMLLPTGADKCPHCYFEGALQWIDESRKETTVDELDINPEYATITKPDPETTEYLSDEVLKDEFDMEPNPKHKYKTMNKLHNKHPEKRPTGQCTVLELAKRLLDLNIGEELNFSENQDGSDYWGAKYMEVFEQQIILFGYYGGPSLQLYEIEKDVLADMVRHLGYHLNKKEQDTIFTFDIIKPKNEEAYKENIVSSYFFYMWNAWCKEECEKIFSWESPHFWEKWCKFAKDTAWGAAEKYYADLSDGYRRLLVKRACEVYDGNSRRKQ